MKTIPAHTNKQRPYTEQEDLLPGGVRTNSVGFDFIQNSEQITSKNFTIPAGETLFVITEIESKRNNQIPIMVGNYRILFSEVGANPLTSIMIGWTNFAIKGPFSLPKWATDVFGLSDLGTDFLTVVKNISAVPRVVYYREDFIYIQSALGGGVKILHNQAVGNFG